MHICALESVEEDVEGDANLHHPPGIGLNRQRQLWAIFPLLFVFSVLWLDESTKLDCIILFMDQNILLP